MNIFISGGCKNGKSFYAQELARDMAASKGMPLYYLATMIPHDEEDLSRIKRHLKEREGWGFQTIEQGFDICTALNAQTTGGKKVDPSGVFLLDSVTALLANEMFKEDKAIDLDAPKRLSDDLIRFALMTGNTVFVSDYIYSDANMFDVYTESYRKGLALIDRGLANICEQAVEVAFGFRYDYK